VTGATALITVPVMILFGIPARTALATNMVTLLFMSVGGSLPFIRGGEIDRARAPVLLTLTLVGSVIGALLVFMVPATLLPLIIPVAMVFVLMFLLINPRMGSRDRRVPSPSRVVCGYGMTLLLGVYGGFFSGGYVTMLIAACVFFFGYTLLRGMVMTRVMNVASSSIATAVFAWHGAVEWRLAVILGCAAFGGALIGAHWSQRVPEKLLRAVFIAAVAALALKSLIFDVPWSSLFHQPVSPACFTSLFHKT
jgi:uncharacterized membrane protein YfcA